MTTTAVSITDPETAPDGVLGAFATDGLDMSANARTDAEATVTDQDVAGAKAMALNHDYGCGNAQPAELRRRADGTLRVRDGARRTIMCQRAGVPLFAFVAGAEGDEQADTRGRLITQWFANHHNKAPARSDDAGLLLALFDTAGMTEAGIAKALGVKRAQVKTALIVARSELASKAADRWDFLTFDQAAALAEFDGQPEAVTRLVQAARQGDGSFEHAVTQLRATATEREERRAFEAEMAEAG